MTMNTIIADLQLISSAKSQWNNNCCQNISCCEHRWSSALVLRGLSGFYCHGNIFCYAPLGKIAVVLILVISNLSHVKASQSSNLVLCHCIMTRVSCKDYKHQ